jgi:hypothetical protein
MCSNSSEHNKLCALTCCPCNLDLEKVESMTNEPKFICTQCGRVANEKEYICQPKEIQ